MTTLPTVLAASFALVAFLLLANLVLVQYGRGVARTAVDEAVRHAAVTGPGNCEAAARAVLADLIGGPFGAALSVACRVDGSVVVASVDGSLPALVPLLPDFPVAVTAAARMEQE